jgi:predicted nucleic acid-binding protein
MILIDTCAIIYLFENNQEAFLLRDDVAVCSFNRDELIAVTHRHTVNTHLKHRIRRFFDSFAIRIIDIPVIPGEREKEKIYVDSVNKELLRLIPDPSDAVLAACALKEHAHILTRDRHHLYTAKLENMFQKNNIAVMKNFSTATDRA